MLVESNVSELSQKARKRNLPQKCRECSHLRHVPTSVPTSVPTCLPQNECGCSHVPTSSGDFKTLWDSTCPLPIYLFTFLGRNSGNGGNNGRNYAADRVPTLFPLFPPPGVFR